MDHFAYAQYHITVVPRFTVQFGERKMDGILGETVTQGTINIKLPIGLVFGGLGRVTVYWENGKSFNRFATE